MHSKAEFVHTLEVGEIGLFVKASRLETESVDNVVDLDLVIFESLLGLLGGGVGADIYERS